MTGFCCGLFSTQWLAVMTIFSRGIPIPFSSTFDQMNPDNLEPQEVTGKPFTRAADEASPKRSILGAPPPG
jgi:hypothetical protein